MRDYLLFDLDGTLTDPKEGITKSVQYALRHYGIQVEDLDQLIPFIGPPLMDSFQEYYGFTPEQAKEGVQVYREYFTSKGWQENLVFPGVPEMLKRLKEAGKHLYVATSKPEVFALKILKHFDLEPYFEGVGGADLEEKRCRKADVIRYLLEREGICGTGQDSPWQDGAGGPEPSAEGEGKEVLGHILMVGDRKHDVLGAAQLGIGCVGVDYGYAAPGELEESGAIAVVKTVEELRDLLLTL